MTAISLRNIVIKSLNVFNPSSISHYRIKDNPYSTDQTFEVFVKGPSIKIISAIKKLMSENDILLVSENPQHLTWTTAENKIDMFQTNCSSKRKIKIWHIYCTGTKKDPPQEVQYD